MLARRSSALTPSRANRCARASSRPISSIRRGNASMLERRSALAEALGKTGQSGTGGVGRLRLGEVRNWTLVQIAAFPSTLADLELSVSAALGVAALPAHIGHVVEAGPRPIPKTGPEPISVLPAA